MGSSEGWHPVVTGEAEGVDGGTFGLAACGAERKGEDTGCCEGP